VDTTATGENTSTTGDESTDTGLFPGECGDGVLNVGEACDDGNFDNTDSCTEYCLEPACGDGYLQDGEGCDDGNQDDGDGCNKDCYLSGGTVWTGTFNGADNDDDVGRAVATDGSGAVVVVGSTVVVGEDSNILLWKVSTADGAEVWSRDIVGLGPDIGYDVAVSSNDEIVATGSYHVDVQPDPGAKIWRAGFAPGGNEKWSATTSEDGKGTAIALAPDDSVYVTGTANAQGRELWVEKRTSTGDSAWITQDVYGSDSSCNGDYYQDPEGVVADPPFVYVAWRSTCPGGNAKPRSKVSRFEEASGQVSYNPDGCCLHWRIDVFTPGVGIGIATRSLDMAKGPDDSIVIAGEASNGGYLWGYGPDLFSTEKYQAAHWESDPGGGVLVDVVVDGEGNIILAGVGGRVVKTNAEGQMLWQKTDPTVTLHGVAVDAAGYVYAVGSVDEPGEGKNVWLQKFAP